MATAFSVLLLLLVPLLSRPVTAIATAAPTPTPTAVRWPPFLYKHNSAPASPKIFGGGDSGRRCPILLDQGYNPVTFPSATPSPSPTPSPAANPVAGARVIGGVPLNDSHSPLRFIALLHRADELLGGPVCTAVIVAPRLLFTAAHCVERFQRPSELVVYFGAERRISPAAHGGERRSLLAIGWHPRFDMYDDASVAYDVAYLVLAADVPPGYGPMRVLVNDSLPPEGSVVRNAGYGAQRFSPSGDYDGMDDEVVAQVDMPVTSYKYCADKWNDVTSSEPFVSSPVDPALHVCAGYHQGGCSSCYGDSGGPLFQYDSDDYPVLIALASFAFRCGTRSVPTVYVRVAPFLGSVLPDDGVVQTNSTDTVTLPSEQRDSPFGTPAVPFSVILGLSVAAFGLFLIALGVFFTILRRIRRKQQQPQGNNRDGPTEASGPGPAPVTYTPAPVIVPVIAPPPAVASPTPATYTARPVTNDPSCITVVPPAAILGAPLPAGTTPAGASAAPSSTAIDDEVTTR